VDVPRAAEPLYALPPSRFVAERDALARSLVQRGDGAASAVRKLRRPVGLAWVLNRLAREHPREIAALVAAGDRLRAGQREALSGRGPEALRAAEDELRQRARALRAEAARILGAEGKPPPDSTLGRIELLLRVAAPIPGPARDALTRGLMEREPEIAPGELTGFTVVAGGRAGPDPGGRAAQGGGARAARGATADARRVRAAERAARAEAKRKRRELERMTARAQRDASAARAIAEREERAAAKAAEHAHEARRRAAEARANAERLAARARELSRQR
jgi:hypothetical protein